MSTGIQWTDEVWNPVVGCTKVSQGCKHCYAKTLHDARHRAHREGKLQMVPQYAHPFEVVQLMPDRLAMPLSWRKPRRVFVNSVSDLFHEDVPFEYIDRVFAVMTLARRHVFQVLTKRPERMYDYFDKYFTRHKVAAAASEFSGRRDGALGTCDGEVCNAPFPLPNVHVGTSTEDRARLLERVAWLLKTPAAVRWLSCEPLLEALTVSPFLGGLLHLGTPVSINWVVVGGESGNDARPFDIGWARSIVRQCKWAGIPVFVKQLGALPVDSDCGDGAYLPNHKRTRAAAKAFGFDHTDGLPNILLLKDRHGGDMAEWPEDLRVREFPEPRT